MAYTTSDSVKGGIEVTWDPITGANGGSSLEVGHDAGLAGAVQVISGTAGSVSLQGSLDGVNWAALSNVNGTPIALTALNQLADFTTAARYIRPFGNASSVAAVIRVVLRTT
jgi:hypothetical protein